MGTPRGGVRFTKVSPRLVTHIYCKLRISIYTKVPDNPLSVLLSNVCFLRSVWAHG